MIRVIERLQVHYYADSKRGEVTSTWIESGKASWIGMWASLAMGRIDMSRDWEKGSIQKKGPGYAEA